MINNRTGPFDVLGYKKNSLLQSKNGSFLVLKDTKVVYEEREIDPEGNTEVLIKRLTNLLIVLLLINLEH